LTDGREAWRVQLPALPYVGVPPLKVLPVVAFACRTDISQQLGRVHLQGERTLPAFCVRRGNRLSDKQVEVLAQLIADFPVRGNRARSSRPARSSRGRPAGRPDARDSRSGGT